MPENRSKSARGHHINILINTWEPSVPNKFQSYRSIGIGEDSFYMFRPYMSLAAILDMWPSPFV